MAYGVDQRALFGSGADYVQRILQGSRPAELRMQRAATLELVVNLATARANRLIN
jgi:putative ABC transport system substrate-binding protein